MKKIYVLLLVTVGFVLSAQAQPFEKGDKLLGGSIGYTLQKETSGSNNPDYKYLSLGVSPSLGVFTKTNRLTGFSLEYNLGTSISSNSTYEQKYHSYGASIYQQYWNTLGKNFYFIIQGRTGGAYSIATYDYGNGKTDQSKSANAFFTIDPGFAYRIKKRLLLDLYYSNFLALNFTYAKREVTGSNSTSIYSFGANTGLRNFSLDNFRFGFRYLL